MNVLMLTVVKANSIEDKGIYTDLLRTFRNNGHNVHMITIKERRDKGGTQIIKEDKSVIVQMKTLNLQKTNFIEKGISIFLIENQFKWAIKKFFEDIKFDLLLYSTPPINYASSIKYLKKRDGVFSYLLLKDIFPQNAVDMGMMSEGGFFYNFFRQKEKSLYQLSDVIGCMSQANVDYVLKHNPDLAPSKVEINYNSVEYNPFQLSDEEKLNIRSKYDLPLDRKIFIYGGNLGKPQGIGFLLETIAACKRLDVFFLIIGDGTEYNFISDWFEKNKPLNARLHQQLPKNDFDRLVASSDVGLIYLDPAFTIPNYPSRVLAYLECALPVIAATDNNTDIGTDLEKAGCGLSVISGDISQMLKAIDFLLDESDRRQMGKNGHKLLLEKFLVETSYKTILSRFNEAHQIQN